MLLTVDVGNTHTVIGGYAGAAAGESPEGVGVAAGVVRGGAVTGSIAACAASEGAGAVAGAAAAEGAGAAACAVAGAAAAEGAGAAAGGAAPAGIATGAAPQFVWRMVTNHKQTEDEIRATLCSMFFAQGLDHARVTGMALASVVPQLTMAWKRVARDMFHTETFICNAQTTKGLFKAKYPNVKEIGSDRIADALASVHRYGAPVVVVDFGTATNIEVVDKDGFFVGGIIAPGVSTSAQALFSYAAKLSATELIAPPAVIGTSTETAIQSGIVYGEAGRVDSLVRGIFSQLGYEAPVIATGGLASIIASCSDTITKLDSELTLEGLRLAYTWNKNKGNATEGCLS